MHYLFFLLLSVILILLFQHFTIRQSKTTSIHIKTPPTPPSLPLLGHLHNIRHLPHRSLQKLSSIHGPIMLLHLGRIPTVVLSSASVVKEAIQLHDLSLSNRPRSINADILTYGSSSVPFTQYGEYWRQARRIYTVHMLSVKQVEALRHVRHEEVAWLIDKIRSDGHSGKKTINLSKLLVDLANNIACRATFGQKYALDSMNKLLEEVSELLLVSRVGEFIPWLGWFDWLRGVDKRAKVTANILDQFLEGVFQQHLQKKRNSCEDDKTMETTNFFDVLLDIEKKGGEIDMPLSMKDIKVFLWDMILGSVDTTYTTMEWIMAELIMHPIEMERVQQEVRRIVHTCGKLNEESIGKMSFLKAAIRETLRLHPPAPLLVPRETTKEIQLLGYHIPAGTRVIINAWAISRDPEYWGNNAHDFMPERFLDTSIDYKGQDFQFTPFGVGRRGCPGINLAIRIVELAIASLLYNFNWELHNGTSGGELLNMTERVGVTVHLKNNMMVLAKPFV